MERKNAIIRLVKDIIISQVAFWVTYMICSSTEIGSALGVLMSICFAGLPFGWRWASKVFRALCWQLLLIKVFFAIMLGWIAIFVVIIGDLIRIFTASNDQPEPSSESPRRTNSSKDASSNSPKRTNNPSEQRSDTSSRQERINPYSQNRSNGNYRNQAQRPPKQDKLPCPPPVEHCIYCGEPIEPDGIFCCNCGQQKYEEKPRVKSVPICSYCNAKVKEGQRFCPVCGEKLF